jgi:uncharacterized protein YciI
MYFLAINRLKLGTGPEGLNQWLPQHQEWVTDLTKKKVMVSAGKWGNVGSAFLFKAENLQKAHAILAQDPLMLHDMVDYQMHEFYPETEIKD